MRMAHLIKLAVGAQTIDDVEAFQAARAPGAATWTVPTRQFPKRAPEIVAGGSLFWVVAGLVAARQEVTDIHEVRRPDGLRATAIVVRREIVPVAPRIVRAFQGWRYLEDDAAPPDLHGADVAGAPGGFPDALPPALARALAALCLI